jgi:hypothetical protein
MYLLVHTNTMIEKQNKKIVKSSKNLKRKIEKSLGTKTKKKQTIFLREDLRWWWW